MKRSTHAALTFASENFLSHKTLVMLGDIKHQLLGLLAGIGFVPDMPDLRRKMRKDSVASLTGEQVGSTLQRLQYVVAESFAVPILKKRQ